MRFFRLMLVALVVSLCSSAFAQSTRPGGKGGGGVALPSQTGNSGKYLTTNGSATSWGTVSAGITGTGTTNTLTYWNGSATVAADTTVKIDATNHRIGVNPISSLSYPLDVGGVPTADQGNAKGLLRLLDSSTGFASTPRAGIVMSGFIDGSSTQSFAVIQGRKENATSGAQEGALEFYTRTAGGLDTLGFHLTSTQVLVSDQASGSTAFGLPEGTYAAFNQGIGGSWVRGDPTIHSLDFSSNVTDSSSNYAFRMSSNANLASAGLFQLRRTTTNVFNIDLNGNVTIGDNTHGAQVTGSQARLDIIGGPTEGATAVGVRIRSQTSLTTAGALVSDWQNGVTTVASIDKDGNFKSASHITCAMSSSSSCTATVPSGSVCHCQATSGTANAVSCAVATTTATCTASGPNSATWNVFVY